MFASSVLGKQSLFQAWKTLLLSSIHRSFWWWMKEDSCTPEGLKQLWACSSCFPRSPAPVLNGPPSCCIGVSADMWSLGSLSSPQCLHDSCSQETSRLLPTHMTSPPDNQPNQFNPTDEHPVSHLTQAKGISDGK